MEYEDIRRLNTLLMESLTSTQEPAQNRQYQSGSVAKPRKLVPPISRKNFDLQLLKVQTYIIKCKTLLLIFCIGTGLVPS